MWTTVGYALVDPWSQKGTLPGASLSSGRYLTSGRF